MLPGNKSKRTKESEQGKRRPWCKIAAIAAVLITLVVSAVMLIPSILDQRRADAESACSKQIFAADLVPDGIPCENLIGTCEEACGLIACECGERWVYHENGIWFNSTTEYLGR